MLGTITEWCIIHTDYCGGATAWVQAVGSVLAIVAAAVIASVQHWAQERRIARSECSERRRIRELCEHFATTLEVTLDRFSHVCRAQDERNYGAVDARLKDLIQLAEQMDIARLPAGTVLPFLSLRQIAADGRALALQALGALPHGSEHWADRFGALRDVAHQLAEVLLAAFSTARVPA